MKNPVSQILKSKGEKIWSIAPYETAYKALQLMSEKNLGALLVIEEEKVVGLFSERDYARKAILKGKASKTTNVSELMTKEVLYVDPETSVEDCMSLMTAKCIRHLPVMEKKQLVGVVSQGDVVKQLIADQKFENEELERYIHEEC
ncbi:signal-transduction protein [Candidatus Scalindua japonica]|uniref:Signal-transduction protein n=1 Tax=Candidatus Scalindua japonica TaxID=1284222 RepID=A0A286TZT0_9BACT|nr:CBS domain-containing protein [Candidatus Scalindua japonica]GAX61392.1 signal-transduction protein [Candidatus Scalindua japonica]